MKRLKIILNCLTQLLGAVLCVTLNANESTSGACYRRKDSHKGFYIGYRVINGLFFFQDDHCRHAAEQECVDSQELLDAYTK